MAQFPNNFCWETKRGEKLTKIIHMTQKIFVFGSDFKFFQINSDF